MKSNQQIQSLTELRKRAAAGENIQAELLDVITVLVEAFNRHGHKADSAPRRDYGGASDIVSTDLIDRFETQRRGDIEEGLL